MKGHNRLLWLKAQQHPQVSWTVLYLFRSGESPATQVFLVSLHFMFLYLTLFYFILFEANIMRFLIWYSHGVFLLRFEHFLEYLSLVLSWLLFYCIQFLSYCILLFCFVFFFNVVIFIWFIVKNFVLKNIFNANQTLENLKKKLFLC